MYNFTHVLRYNIDQFHQNSNPVVVVLYSVYQNTNYTDY